MVARKEFLDNTSENAYKDKLVPFIDQQEKEGKWKKLTCEPVNDYFGESFSLEGLLVSYQML